MSATLYSRVTNINYVTQNLFFSIEMINYTHKLFDFISKNPFWLPIINIPKS